MLRSLKFTNRLRVLIATFTIGFIAYGALSITTFEKYRIGSQLDENISAMDGLISDVMPPPEYIVEAYLVSLQLRHAPKTEAAALIARLIFLKKEYVERHYFWQRSSLTPEIKVMLYGEANLQALHFYQIAFDEFLPALAQENEEGMTQALDKMSHMYALHRLAIDDIIKTVKHETGALKSHTIAQLEFAIMLQVGILFVFLVASIIFARLIRRSIVLPLAEAVALARRVATGDLSKKIETKYNDETGQLLESLNDMSESLRAILEARDSSEAAARDALSLLENLIDTANVMVVALDRSGCITIFNGVAELVSGYPRAEVIGKKWSDLSVLPQPQSWQLDFSLISKNDMPRSFQQEIIGKTGDVRTIAWKNSSLDTNTQLNVAVISVGIDVTEQIKLDKALLEAKQAAELANRGKSEFLANMSHEIRTPMNAVIGMTALALRTDLTEKQRNYLEKSKGAAESLLGIINDVLDYSKIEAGKLHFEYRAFNVDSLLRHLVALLGFKAQDKGLALVLHVAPDVPLALIGDEMRLGQVLLNLLSNALKFTDQGEVCLNIYRVCETGDQVVLRFEVSDTGIGISEKQRLRLFSAFVQADSSTTRHHGGTGLGLTISRSLVEMMEGEIWVETNRPAGSRFIFTAQLGLQTDQSAATAIALPNLYNLRALVIDDDDAALEIMSEILRSFRIDVSVASSGEAGLVELEAAKQRNEPYHLIFLDWKMPSLSGLETVRKIRLSRFVAKTVTIIMVTAYSRDELMLEAVEIKIDGILEKPISASNVLNIISTALYKARVLEEKDMSLRTYEDLVDSVKGAYVLLVEDNQVNQELALDVLISAGMKVDVANNGAEAIAMIAKSSYDVVIMDWQMPVMDGFEATRRIRSDSTYENLPIIAMTANAMAGDREKCLAAGMNDHIAKPIDIDDLITTMSYWVKPRRSGGNGFASSDGRHEFPSLQNVDMDDAKKRLRGNAKMYWRLMELFAKDQSHAIHAISALLATKDIVAAARVAHDLKGLCANLGARALVQHVHQLEAAIRTRQTDAEIASLLAAVKPPLHLLLAEIALLQAQESPPDPQFGVRRA